MTENAETLKNGSNENNLKEKSKLNEILIENMDQDINIKHIDKKLTDVLKNIKSDEISPSANPVSTKEQINIHNVRFTENESLGRSIGEPI